MNNFQSYIAGQDEGPQPDNIRDSGPQVHIRGDAHFVSTSRGVVTETTQGTDRGSVDQLNPGYGSGTWAETARHPQGLPVTELLPSTLVTISGVQAPIAFWVSEGILQKAPDGGFVEAVPQAQIEQSNADNLLPIAPAAMDQINAALETVDQGHLDNLAAVGMGVAVGRLDPAALATRFSQVSGLDGPEGAARLDTIKAAYQAQADEALTARCGLTADDLPGFYAWAREHRQGQLQETITRQLHTHAIGGWRALASEWFTSIPPSVEALKAAGLPVRQLGARPEVYLRGSWMSTEAAARAGLI